MRVLLLNQFFPPDSAPTGELMAELGRALVARGHQADFIDAGGSYRQTQRRGSRTWREMRALAKMLWNGLRHSSMDVVIAGSSPPCVLVVAAVIARWHRAQLIHWAMDLYPELAVALGELRNRSLITGFKRLMKWGYGACTHVVALDQDMVDRLQCYGVKAKIIQPWVFAAQFPNAIQKSNSAGNGEWTWMYSGNLGRAHEWETILRAQAILEARGLPIRLIFQGGGPGWAPAQARAQELNLRQCEWRPYVPVECLAESLLEAHCLVATQLLSTQGLLWPSKLAALLSLPRHLLWIGPIEGAVARQLAAHASVGIFAPDAALDVADWLKALSFRTEVPKAPLNAAIHRETNLQQWMRLIDPLGDPADSPELTLSK